MYILLVTQPHTYTGISGDFRRRAFWTLFKFYSIQIFFDPSELEVITLDFGIVLDVSLTDFLPSVMIASIHVHKKKSIKF